MALLGNEDNGRRLSSNLSTGGQNFDEDLGPGVDLIKRRFVDTDGGTK